MRARAGPRHFCDYSHFVMARCYLKMPLKHYYIISVSLVWLSKGEAIIIQLQMQLGRYCSILGEKLHAFSFKNWHRCGFFFTNPNQNRGVLTKHVRASQQEQNYYWFNVFVLHQQIHCCKWKKRDTFVAPRLCLWKWPFDILFVINTCILPERKLLSLLLCGSFAAIKPAVRKCSCFLSCRNSLKNVKQRFWYIL